MAVLDLPNLSQRVHRVSVARYHQLAELGCVHERTELIRGVIVDKMSKSPLHSTLLAILEDLLRPQLPADHLLRRDDPLTLEDSEPEPDISIVRGSRSDFVKKHPVSAELVVEVAVSSLAEDRSLAALYAEAEVKEYWIVIAATRQIEVYRKPAAGQYAERQLYSANDVVECASLSGVRLAVKDLFVVME